MKHLHYAANEPGSLGELFDRGAYARNTDPDTSHEAAEHVANKKATRLEAMALQSVRERGTRGATNHDIAEDTGVDWQTITPRMKPLKRKGLVYDSGERREGPTGRPCIVWKAIT